MQAGKERRQEGPEEKGGGTEGQAAVTKKQTSCPTSTQVWDSKIVLGSEPSTCPECLTQYSPESFLVLLCKSLERIIGPFGLSAGKVEEIGAGSHTGVSRGQVTSQEIPTHRSHTGACGEKLRTGRRREGERKGQGSPKGLGKGMPGEKGERDPVRRTGPGAGLGGGSREVGRRERVRQD